MDAYPATMKTPYRSASFLPIIHTLISLSALLLTACGYPQPASTPIETNPTSMGEIHADIFILRGEIDDLQALQDVAEALRTNAPEVRRAMDYDYRGPVTVEIFPDQDSLDRFGSNPQMRGYYAYSGDHLIQMVSPRQPIPGLEVGYTQRVLIAVHEFVHLVNNAINPDMPLWLNEGLAVYFGPHEIYTYVCRHSFPFEMIPALDDLELSYASVPAGDLFAYSFVDFIATEYGQETLMRMLRETGPVEAILGSTRSECEQNWRDFLHEHYTGR